MMRQLVEAFSCIFRSFSARAFSSPRSLLTSPFASLRASFISNSLIFAVLSEASCEGLTDPIV